MLERPGSACLRETESVRQPARFESPYRRPTAPLHHTLGPRRTDPDRRVTGIACDQKAATYQLISQNLGDFNIIKERIDVLKKKYN